MREHCKLDQIMSGTSFFMVDFVFVNTATKTQRNLQDIYVQSIQYSASQYRQVYIMFQVWQVGFKNPFL